MALDETGIDLARRQRRDGRQRLEEVDIVGEPDDLHLAERRHETPARPLAILAPDDQLGQHGIVMDRDLVAGPDAGVDPDMSVRFRQREMHETARRGQEIARRILGVDPGLDRMAPCRDLGLGRHGSGSPAATRSCHSTRSSPVTISVTGCSTWSRVFISMKKNSPERSTMNSMVPAPT